MKAKSKTSTTFRYSLLLWAQGLLVAAGIVSLLYGILRGAELLNLFGMPLLLIALSVDLLRKLKARNESVGPGAPRSRGTDL